MARTVQTIGEPIRLTLTDEEDEAFWAHIARLEAGSTATERDEWLAARLAARGLPALPEDFCWHLAGRALTIKAVAPEPPPQ